MFPATSLLNATGPNLLPVMSVAVDSASRLFADFAVIRGWPSVASHIRDVALSTALIVLCAAVGRRVLRYCGIEFRATWDALGFAIAVGAAVVACGMLAAAVVGELNPAAIAVVLCVLGAAAVRDVAATVTAVFRTVRVAWAVCRTSPAAALAALVVAWSVVFMLAVALAPPVEWDSLMYHLRIPEQFLAWRKIALPEDNLHVAFVGLPHMLYLPLLLAGGLSAPAVLSVFFAVTLALLIAGAVARFGSARGGWFGAALLWSTPSIWLVAMTARVDVTLVLFLFAGHYALLLGDTPGRVGARYRGLAAALCGCAIGVKYHAVAYTLVLLPLWWLVARRAGVRGRQLGYEACLCGGLVLLCGAPWLLKNFVLLSAPLFPFGASPRLEPWIATLFGGTAWPDTVSREALATLAAVRQRFNLVDLFVAPGRLTVEGEGVFYFPSPVLPMVLLPAGVLAVRDRRVRQLAGPALAYGAVLVCVSPATNLRYLIPAIVPLTVAAAILIVRHLAKLRLSHAKRELVLAVVLLLGSLPSLLVNGQLAARLPLVSYLSGRLSAADYVTEHPDPGIRAYEQIVRVANERLPADSRILMLFEARGLYFHSAVLADARLTNWSLIRSARKQAECLAGTGVTHVLVGVAALDFYHSRGLDLHRLHWEDFSPFAERCLTLLHSGGAFLLYAVRPAEDVRLRVPKPEPWPQGRERVAPVSRPER